MKSKPPKDPRAAAKRAALNALRRARRLVERNGAKLSEWEGEFLGSVEERVETYGRAFGDPEKGAAGQALSALQTVKLKEIAAKAKSGSRSVIEEVEAVVLDDGDEEDATDPAPPRGPAKRSSLRRRGFGQ